MSPKFSGPRATMHVPSPIRTVGRGVTYEGGAGYVRDAKSELFLLAVSNMVGESNFYEAAQARDDRYTALIAQVVAEDPSWIARFVPFLRNEMQMRSASAVMACEYVRAGGPNGRTVIAAACSRADEPAEILGYWASKYGRRFPQPVKRGVADAVVRLYNEYSALRYDGQSRAWRMGDVIELTHPRPRGSQTDLFRFLLDVRHHNDGLERIESLALPALRAAATLEAMPVEERRNVLSNPQVLDEAGFSWERLSGWLPGGMDKDAWEAIIPSMGYMALLRNLRNFDDAGVSDAVANRVISKLSDPDEVAKSRQFPVRFLSAWANTASMRWGSALEQALEHSLTNVPVLPGKTLILTDVSGSMVDDHWIPRYHGAKAGSSVVKPWQTAAVFGAALARRAEYAELYSYGTSSERINVNATTSLLRALDAVEKSRPFKSGTQTIQTVAKLWSGHDRVIVLTDEQAFAADRGSNSIVDSIPTIYTFNLAGYRPGHLPAGGNGRYSFGGLTDVGFKIIPLLEASKGATWPF